MAKKIQKISPFLWFDTQAEEAANLYVSLFKNSKITGVVRYEHDLPRMPPKGSVMTVNFELEGLQFTALNGGPMFKFNESISLVVHCDSQEEIDHFWEKLSEGGEESRCGWLKDKFGLSWQIVPSTLGDLMQGDPKKSKQVMEALLQMDKLDIKALQDAYAR